MSEARAPLTEILDALDRLIAEARVVPLSNSLLVPGDECRALVAELRTRLGEELAGSAQILAARDEVLAEARAKADAMIAEARAKVDEMIARSGLRAAAEARAEEIVEEACTKATELTRQTDDWIDRRLAGVEIVLQDLLEHTRRGRNRLAAGSRRSADAGADA